MHLTLPSPPSRDVQSAAIAWLHREDAIVGAPDSKRNLFGWHRAFLPRTSALTGGPADPPGLCFANWCCLVQLNDDVTAWLTIARPPNTDPQVVGVTSGLAMQRWLAAIAAARAHPDPTPGASFELALLRLPDAQASGLLLLPSSALDKARVWLVMSHARDCPGGLHTLDQVLATCAAAPSPDELARERTWMA